MDSSQAMRKIGPLSNDTTMDRDVSRADERPLRVLIVAPSLDIIGGQSRQAIRLREGLKKETSLYIDFLPHNPRLPWFLRWLQSLKYVRTIVTTLVYWAMLVARIRKYDIIHIFSASYYSYTLSVMPALLIAKLFGKRSILNYRSGEAEDHLENWRTAIPTIKWANEIVVPSGYLVDVFARYGLHARAIYNIVELERFSFRERRPLRPVFLTSRLLEPLYNVPCVLRAFAIIQQRFPQARLTVAADGWLRNDLELLACDLKLRNVEFIGFVPFEAMPDLYDSADIYLSATNIDNMPSSITESMAAGLNVVTTDGGGAIPYIMTNEVSGLIVERDDHEALAAAAIRLLNDPDLATRLARNAREASKKFSWPFIRDEWVNLYFDLAKDLSFSVTTTNQGPVPLVKTDSGL
jgi:glycosyltransferase involved in cell wall biosynthesis